MRYLRNLQEFAKLTAFTAFTGRYKVIFFKTQYFIFEKVLTFYEIFFWEMSSNR